MTWAGRWAGLVLVHLAMIGAWSLVDLLIAMLLGGVVALVSAPRAGVSTAVLVQRVVALPWFIIGLLLFIARGGLQMLVVLVRRAQPAAVDCVELPFGARSEAGAAMTGLVASATPGSAFVSLDAERRVVLLNVIDASDPEAVRRELDSFYRRFQRHVYP